MVCYDINRSIPLSPQKELSKSLSSFSYLPRPYLILLLRSYVLALERLAPVGLL